MGKIRVLSDNLANQIAAGEVVERPASVAKELLENSLDAGATRILIEIEAGGRRLLKITDDGEGMTRDDAVLAFERHATSKLRTLEDLNSIATLGFSGEALASIASVARVELTTKTKSESATRVVIEGGRLIDVKDAAHPVGTTVIVRDLFFNTPARRKFLRSEATENFHLINLVTHYALAHPDKAFTLNNNGREAMRVTPARTLRERAFQIFGGDLIESLLAVGGGREFIAKVSGFISAPRERRTTRDAQYFFINGRFVRDKILGRAVTEGYRSVLPHGVYPVALLFVEIPTEEVDVNVHPAKTEVRFRRPEAVRESVTEAIRAALMSSGIIPDSKGEDENPQAGATEFSMPNIELPDQNAAGSPKDFMPKTAQEMFDALASAPPESVENQKADDNLQLHKQSEAEFSVPIVDENAPSFETLANEQRSNSEEMQPTPPAHPIVRKFETEVSTIDHWAQSNTSESVMPPLDSAAKLPKSVGVDSLPSSGIRPIGQLHQSYIIATDAQGLLLVDQHVAHERILFDKFRRYLSERKAESQNLLLPETLDLSPAQAAAFNLVQNDLEDCGFGLMRLSGRTVAIKAVPADLPAGEARNLLREILETIDAEKRGTARDTLRDDIAASLACKAAVKVNMSLTMEKMQWLCDKLLTTSSPTTCPHGRPVILRLTMKDIERGFHRT
ncbi:MAG: DNA mismatch repair endonuclease MutL [Pyrinomonadaceae bacterium]